MAIERPPDPPPHKVPRRPVERRARGEAHEIEPLVRGQTEPDGRLRLDEREALRAAGEGVEALVAEDLRGCDREREGGEREIKAAEPERGKAEQKAGDEAHDAGQRDGRPVRQAEFRYQDRRSVAADGEKGAVAERYLAIEAGQQIEAEQRDRRR